MTERLDRVALKNQPDKVPPRISEDKLFLSAKAVAGLLAVISLVEASRVEASASGSDSDNLFAIFLLSAVGLGLTQVVHSVHKKEKYLTLELNRQEDFGNKDKYQKLVLSDEDGEAYREFEEKFVMEDLLNKGQIQPVTIFENEHSSN